MEEGAETTVPIHTEALVSTGSEVSEEGTSRFYDLRNPETDTSIGWGNLHLYPDQTAEIETFIDEDYRRQGKGSLLSSKLEDEARTLGATTMRALIAENNSASQRANEKSGYVRDESREPKEIHGKTYYWYIKKLT